jgi:protein TonB
MYSLSSNEALRRVPTRLVLVAGLHLVVISALINGLHVRLGPAPPPAITGSVIETPAPTPEKFTPPPLTLSKTNVTLDQTPLPVFEPVVTEIQPQPLTDPLPSASLGAAVQTYVPVPAPVVVGAAVDPRHPLTQPAYPSASIRMNEEGALSLSVLVGADGRVHEAKVAQSSGSSRLDQAAVDEARTRWHLRPATRNGVPFEQWLTLRVIFRLENR